jgi:glutamate/tyrosine decarboxylase-like PLP-dependent enzyme
MEQSSDPLSRRDDLEAALDLAHRAAVGYLAGLDGSPVHPAAADAAAERFTGSLPESGLGALQALGRLTTDGLEAANRTNGPRMFHFVTGGVTPAALAADWLTSAIDQNAFSWVNSPLASRLEQLSISWLKDLFGLPPAWGGVLTTGATMANFSALAAARRWWGERYGVDIEEDGLGALPHPITVLAGGYLHTSAAKAIAMLGIGRGAIRRLPADASGRMDLDAIEDAIRDLDGRPVILSATAGDVDTGAFDPIGELAELAQRYRVWLHVDGAFGLFAGVSPTSAHLVNGIDGAHSVIADGHKWLNVPYDCGFAFVRDPQLLARTFAAGAAYLPRPDDPRPTFGYQGPEMSRRARALPVWATLAAYGRDGYREMVERHLALAQRLAALVDDAPDLERLAEVPLDIVCFRYRPDARGEAALDGLNRDLGARVLEDGRVYVGQTTHRGVVCFRPAIVNWMTAEADIDELVRVIRELGAGLA